MKNLTPEEQAVFDLIANSVRVTQLQIARSVFVGCHEKFEGYDKPKESTLRQVRQIIRDLRIKHRLPILSDSAGYWLMRDKGEAQAFIERLERTAKSQAAAWFSTFRALKNSLGVQSDYFEGIKNDEVVVKQHVRRKHKEEKRQGGQNYLF